MGCFSYICKKSGEPILSTSFSGDAVYLFLLKDGKVIEEMYGNYDSYGRVFGTEESKNEHLDNESFGWEHEWGSCIDLHFNDKNDDGFAAILAEFYDGVHPTTISEDDPNQGWGKHYDLMDSTSKELGKVVLKPYHKIY
jgi:hypothetical protein